MMNDAMRFELLLDRAETWANHRRCAASAPPRCWRTARCSRPRPILARELLEERSDQVADGGQILVSQVVMDLVEIDAKRYASSCWRRQAPAESR